MEDWAEIRRLHRAEHVPIKAIARRLGIARNTVRAALASDAPPKYQRAGKQSLVDAAEPEVRKLLLVDARMPATVIVQRIGWQRSLTILKDRIRQIRPEYAGVDPADRLVHEPGQAAQMDLWFPEPRIPVGFGQAAMLPVLVMTLTYSRFLSALMLPSRQAGDLLAGMWQLISQVGAVSKTLVWDREAAIGGKGVVTAAAAAFAGTLATRVVLAPPRDPEFKGMTERNNGFLETSFLPGRQFASRRGRALLRTEPGITRGRGRSRYGRLEQYRSPQPREGTAGTATVKHLVQVLVSTCRLSYHSFSYPVAEGRA